MDDLQRLNTRNISEKPMKSAPKLFRIMFPDANRRNTPDPKAQAKIGVKSCSLIMGRGEGWDARKQRE